MNNIEVKVKDKVLKPIDEVVDAVWNPEKLSGFFISRADGPMVEGETITWYFDDVGGHLLINILEVAVNGHIAFEWAASGIKARVDMLFGPVDDSATTVTITENSFPFDAAGVKKALQQTQGWTDFLCSMKAFLYCDINLRSGRTKISYK